MLEKIKHIDPDLDMFNDGWKKRGNGYVWIQRGKDVKKYMPLLEQKKRGALPRCPKCDKPLWYSSKLKGSKCRKCGYFLPLNAVIEI